MNIEELREYALSLEYVEECTPFGDETLVFKTNGKMFMAMGIYNSPLQFNVKCDPAKAIELREQYGAVQPGYHMNKKHWNTVIIDGSLNKKLLKQFISDSYKLVLKIKNNV
jgi:predicted DNA-binding protein (MmcQ/YjbR family)